MKKAGSNVTSVTIPEGVEGIGDRAFGVIDSKGGILNPGGYATRTETAQMLKNFMERQ